jgi:hypothetical protein
MNINKDAMLKKFAEAIQDNYYESNPNGADTCRYCGVHLHGDWNHKSDCIMLLTYEVMFTTDVCSCCNGVDYHLPNGLNCPVCQGTGLTQIGDGEDWERTVKCDSCNGTGVEK